MQKVIAALALLAQASAFVPAPSTSRATVLSAIADPSQSLPFLIRPKKLDGKMVGDYGFDPMELSEIQTDLIYARAAELKHGRMAQLAVLGTLVQEIFPSLYPGVTDHNPLHGLTAVPLAASIQIVLAISLVELATFNYTYNSNTPWNLGWGAKMLDGKSAAQVKDMELKELVHGRLAMIAFVGQISQTLIYNTPLVGGGSF